MKAQKAAYLYAIAAVLCWSTIGTAFKWTLRYTDSFQLVFYSVLTALIFTFIIVCLNGRLTEAFAITPKQWIYSAITGLVNPFVYYVGLIKGYSLLPAQEAGTLNYFWPVILLFLSAIVLKQKIGWLSIAASLISFFGLMVIVTQGHITSLSFSSPMGVGLVMFSTFLFATYWILNMRDKRNVFCKVFLNFLFAFAYIVILQLFRGEIKIPTTNGLLGSIYVGIFEMGLTFALWLKALEKVENTGRISNLVFLSPFISLFFIGLFLGEPIKFATVIGLVLIVSGILLSQVRLAQKHAHHRS